MKQQEAAVDEIVGASRQPGVAGIHSSKCHIAQAGTLTDFGSPPGLLGAGVDSGHAACRADDFGEHAGDCADAAAEIGNVHAWLEAGLEQNAAARRSIDIVKYE